MTGYALYAPYTDEDFAGLSSLPTIDLVFFLDGISSFVAEIPLPSVGGDPVDGGVYYSTPFLSLGSWFKVIVDAMNAADPEFGGGAFWTIFYEFSIASRILKTGINRVATGPAVRDWQIFWDPAFATTFDQKIIGFFTENTSGVPQNGPIITAGDTYTSEWQVGRCWFHPIAAFLEQKPVHRGVHLKGGTYTGRQQVTSYGDITKDRNFEEGTIEGVRVYESLANTPNMIAQMPGLTLGDRNTPLEGLWNGITLGRKPVRYIPNPDAFALGTGDDYQPANMAQLRQLMGMVPSDRQRPRYFNVNIQLQDYVS